jgi:hypothetical protein
MPDYLGMGFPRNHLPVETPCTPAEEARHGILRNTVHTHTTSGSLDCTIVRVHSTNRENDTLYPSNSFTDSESPASRELSGSTNHFMTDVKDREVGFVFIISMLQVLLTAQMNSVLPNAQIIAHSFNIADKGLLPWKFGSIWSGTFTLVSG